MYFLKFGFFYTSHGWLIFAWHDPNRLTVRKLSICVFRYKLRVFRCLVWSALKFVAVHGGESHLETDVDDVAVMISLWLSLSSSEYGFS